MSFPCGHCKYNTNGYCTNIATARDAETLTPVVCDTAYYGKCKGELFVHDGKRKYCSYCKYNKEWECHGIPIKDRDTWKDEENYSHYLSEYPSCITSRRLEVLCGKEAKYYFPVKAFTNLVPRKFVEKM